MKTQILFGTMALVAGSLLAADSNPQDAVKAAAKGLGEKDNYSWKTSIEFGGNEVGPLQAKPKRVAPHSSPSRAATRAWTP